MSAQLLLVLLVVTAAPLALVALELPVLPLLTLPPLLLVTPAALVFLTALALLVVLLLPVVLASPVVPLRLLQVKLVLPPSRPLLRLGIHL